MRFEPHIRTLRQETEYVQPAPLIVSWLTTVRSVELQNLMDGRANIWQGRNDPADVADAMRYFQRRPGSEAE